MKAYLLMHVPSLLLNDDLSKFSFHTPCLLKKLLASFEKSEQSEVGYLLQLSLSLDCQKSPPHHPRTLPFPHLSAKHSPWSVSQERQFSTHTHTHAHMHMEGHSGKKNALFSTHFKYVL